MNLPILDTQANYPIKNCPSGFEAKALLRTWAQQLDMLIVTPGVNLAEINACILRLAEIAYEATKYSKPEEFINDQEEKKECSQIH